MGAFKFGSLLLQVASTTTTGGTTTLVNTSKQAQVFNGTLSENVQLPDATTMSVGQSFELFSTLPAASITIKFNDTTTLSTLSAGNSVVLRLVDNSTSNGTWVSLATASIVAMSTVSATVGLTSNIVATAGNPIIYDTVTNDTSSGYNLGTGKYTIPSTGDYLVTVTTISNSGIDALRLYVNGSPVAFLTAVVTSELLSGSIVWPLNLGDQVWIASNATITYAGNAVFQNAFSITKM